MIKIRCEDKTWFPLLLFSIFLFQILVPTAPSLRWMYQCLLNFRPNFDRHENYKGILILIIESAKFLFETKLCSNFSVTISITSFGALWRHICKCCFNMPEITPTGCGSLPDKIYLVWMRVKFGVFYLPDSVSFMPFWCCFYKKSHRNHLFSVH